MTTPELKPCPYCGSIESVVFTWLQITQSDTCVVVRCANCGVQGPRKRTNIAAAKAWNLLVSAVALEVLEVDLAKSKKTIHRLAKALRVKNRALAIAQRECKHAQERAAKTEGM